MGEQGKEVLLESPLQKGWIPNFARRKKYYLDEHERKTQSATKFKYDAYIEKTRVRKLEKENEELKDRLLGRFVQENLRYFIVWDLFFYEMNLKFLSLVFKPTPEIQMSHQISEIERLKTEIHEISTVKTVNKGFCRLKTWCWISCSLNVILAVLVISVSCYVFIFNTDLCRFDEFGNSNSTSQ